MRRVLGEVVFEGSKRNIFLGFRNFSESGRKLLLGNVFFETRANRNPRCTFNNSRRNFRASSVSLKQRDYYEVLGIQKGASKAEIKKKYFEMAKKYHPDVNKEKGAESKFKEISEAYEVLEDDKKRQMYDAYGHQGVNGNMGDNMGGNPFSGFGGPFQGGFSGFQYSANGQQVNINPEDFMDMFEQAFGGGGRKGPRKGRDVQANLRLSFQEAVHGCEKEVNYSYSTGTTSKGRAQTKTQKVKVTIPAGVDHGVVMRFSMILTPLNYCSIIIFVPSLVLHRRMGDHGSEGDTNMPRGDLLIVIEVSPDPYFKRDDTDIHVEVPLSFTKVTSLIFMLLCAGFPYHYSSLPLFPIRVFCSVSSIFRYLYFPITLWTQEISQ